jgi:group II intron reverse transcriptase/maturase
MGETSSSQTISTQLQQIAEQAEHYPEMVFTTLAHRIDVDFQREAYRRVRKDAAPGVDGVTAEEYAENLEENLKGLHERLRTGRYVAPPVKRVWLDKEDGGKRPIGKPAFEDKIVQRAVVMLLGAIYERDFYNFSHGFREGHSQHQALRELREKCLGMNIRWIVDADVSGFFDSLDQGKLREVIKQRVNDGGILRLIGKWLKAGVQEGNRVTYPETGTPQGGVISPMLSNIFLHHVLDGWFVKEVQPRMKGRCFLVRWADDFIIGCEYEQDANRIMKVLPKRFGRFGLTIHPTKTALVKFRKPDPREEKASGNGTFEFLGFTHYWVKTRRGFWTIARKTAQKRLIRFVRSTWQWCRTHRHLPVREQHYRLSQKLLGFYQYHAVRMNYRALKIACEEAERAWRRWLSRRTWKGKVSWEQFHAIRRVWPLPRPRILHNI